MPKTTKATLKPSGTISHAVTKAGVAKPKGKAKAKKAGKTNKKPLTEQQKAQRKQVRDCRLAFQRFGFKQIKTDGQEFTFLNRTGEFDDCFVFENVVVLLEYTVGSTGSSHPLTKKVLFDKVLDNQGEWIDFFGSNFSDFKAVTQSQSYTPDQYRVFIVYYAESGVSDEVEASSPRVKFLTGPQFRYFQLLSKTLSKTARYELFKYLGLLAADTAKQVLSSSASSRNFNGYLLPESHSSFPQGFKVTSFYADPSSLMRMSYVLRRDSWRHDDGLYQRILIPAKIRSMRKYLADEQRVFVNNVIVTLPSSTNLNDPTSGKNLDAKTLTKVMPVTVALTDAPHSIGIVDGQHRIFSYHEGADKYEPTIASFRDKQNLLVTGVIFPEAYTDAEQLRFQAKLFLEINDQQTGARSDLKQAIELILNPYSTAAIAKATVMKLAHSGPLKELLQVSAFDEGQKIKTTSIVSYGVRPLVKFDGEDTLFRHWPETNRALLKDASDSAEAHKLLDAYIAFCAEKINDLLLGAKMAHIDGGTDLWKLDPGAKSQFLSPTVINGWLVCLRLLAQSSKLQSSTSYRSKLQGLSEFSFKTYRSSQWRKMGELLYETYF